GRYVLAVAEVPRLSKRLRCSRGWMAVLRYRSCQFLVSIMSNSGEGELTSSPFSPHVNPCCDAVSCVGCCIILDDELTVRPDASVEHSSLHRRVATNGPH